MVKRDESKSNGSLPAYQSEKPIAVDACGGDNGFEVVVEGAVQAYIEFGVKSILVGPKDELTSCLDAFSATQMPIEIHHASQVIEMSESPTRSIRRKPDASLCVAYDLLQSGAAAAVISAGNSGAMMAAGRIKCGVLTGIERPAIATLIPVPGDGHPNVILDSGANVDCSAHNLLQFAIMGNVYCKSLFGINAPKVALLSNGTETSKGTDVIRAASQLLTSLEQINYVGYVEGRDIGTDTADIIVCDGFVGNVVLKALEGCVRLVANQLRHESKQGLFRKIGMGFSRKVYRNVFEEKFDYSAYGGAPLLGLQKLALVLHGASDQRAVKNAIHIADTFARKRMVENLTQELSQLEDTTLELEGDLFSGVLATAGGKTNSSVLEPRRRAPVPENLPEKKKREN